jgi:hypothetical protein
MRQPGEGDSCAGSFIAYAYARCVRRLPDQLAVIALLKIGTLDAVEDRNLAGALSEAKGHINCIASWGILSG